MTDRTRCPSVIDTATTHRERLWANDEARCDRYGGHEGWHESRPIAGRAIQWDEGVEISHSVYSP